MRSVSGAAPGSHFPQAKPAPRYRELGADYDRRASGVDARYAVGARSACALGAWVRLGWGPFYAPHCRGPRRRLAAVDPVGTADAISPTPPPDAFAHFTLLWSPPCRVATGMRHHRARAHNRPIRAPAPPTR